MKSKSRIMLTSEGIISQFAKEAFWKSLKEHYLTLNENDKKEFLDRMFPNKKEK